MLKKLSILLLCLPLMGFGIIPISGRRDAAPGGGIEDDFSGDLSKWTNLSGTAPTIVSGELRYASSGSFIYTDEQTSTISQWALVQYVGGSNPGFPDYAGIYFRSTNNASEYAYCLRVTQTETLAWRDCQGHTCSDIETASGPSIQAGDWFGLEVTGTGNQTAVDVWDFDGTPPANRASWGTPDDTLTSNPSNDADTGKYVGMYKGNNNNYENFDNFSAGDI